MNLLDSKEETIEFLTVLSMYLRTVEKMHILRIYKGKLGAAKIYLKQFEGELKSANTLATQAYLSMDYSSYDFCKYTVKVARQERANGKEIKNFFQILEEVI